MKHLALSSVSHTPPPGVGGCRWIIGIWEKKSLDYWYLREQKSVFGPAEGRKFLMFLSSKALKNTVFTKAKHVFGRQNYKKNRLRRADSVKPF